MKITRIETLVCHASGTFGRRAGSTDSLAMEGVTRRAPLQARPTDDRADVIAAMSPGSLELLIESIAREVQWMIRETSELFAT